MKLHKRWAASWRRSCKQKKDAKYRRGGKTSSPVLFEPIRTFSRVGHGVGQAVDPHFDPHHFQRFCNKKAPKTEVFDAFLELLGRFELPTSSLPTAVEPSNPCCTRLFGGFLSKKDEVTACLFHCFRPRISPCGSRCGSSGNFCIKEAADRLHRHISFCRFPLIIDSGDLLNESLLLLAGFRP